MANSDSGCRAVPPLGSAEPVRLHGARRTQIWPVCAVAAGVLRPMVACCFLVRYRALPVPKLVLAVDRTDLGQVAFPAISGQTQFYSGSRNRQSPEPALPSSHCAPSPPRRRDRRGQGAAQRAGTRLSRPGEHARKHAGMGPNRSSGVRYSARDAARRAGSSGFIPAPSFAHAAAGAAGRGEPPDASATSIA